LSVEDGAIVMNDAMKFVPRHGRYITMMRTNAWTNEVRENGVVKATKTIQSGSQNSHWVAGHYGISVIYGNWKDIALDLCK